MASRPLSVSPLFLLVCTRTLKITARHLNKLQCARYHIKFANRPSYISIQSNAWCWLKLIVSHMHCCKGEILPHILIHSIRIPTQLIQSTSFNLSSFWSFCLRFSPELGNFSLIPLVRARFGAIFAHRVDVDCPMHCSGLKCMC